MAQTLTVTGNFNAPLEDSTATAPVSLNVTFAFTGRADFSRAYSGVVTNDPVSLGTLATPGAKAVLVKCILGTCTITFNGGSDAWPLNAAGGFFLWSNISQGFLTSAAITTPGAATVIFVALG